jgi:hypothetical protein
MNSTVVPARPGFAEFYRHHYLPEHRQPANVALHLVGTVAGLAWLAAVPPLGLSFAWWLLFPVIHAAPGLLGHRLFERNEKVGDLRVLRKDFPAPWFIAANHLLLFDLLGRALGLRGGPPR